MDKLKWKIESVTHCEKSSQIRFKVLTIFVHFLALKIQLWLGYFLHYFLFNKILLNNK